MSEDTWSELQAHKKRQDSLRERIQRRKKESQGIILAATEDNSATTGDNKLTTEPDASDTKKESADTTKPETKEVVKIDPLLEKWILEYLCDKSLSIPIDSLQLLIMFTKDNEPKTAPVLQEHVDGLLEKLAVQNFINIKPGSTKDGKPRVLITEIDYAKLEAIVEELEATSASSSNPGAVSKKRKRDGVKETSSTQEAGAASKNKKKGPSDDIQTVKVVGLV